MVMQLADERVIALDRTNRGVSAEAAAGVSEIRRSSCG